MARTAISLLSVVLITVLTCSLAYLVDSGIYTVFGWPVLPALALLAFVVQWLAFIPAFTLQSEHFYDLTGSLTYALLVIVALVACAQEPQLNRAYLLAGLITIWYVRLGSFLFRRVRRSGKDARFDKLKTSFSEFLMAWTLQGLWVFLTLIAALIAISSQQQTALGLWALIGTIVWVFGFAIEAISDAQKSAFKKDPKNRGAFIRTGLWAYSRHPNYFGEIVLWLGIAIIAVPCFAGWQWLGLISPVFVALLITRLSGVPILERRSDETWGENPQYQDYKRRTPVLIPRIR
ncbi:MAG: DUF1295 domain-containing protein [Oceanococcus sp.]